MVDKNSHIENSVARNIAKVSEAGQLAIILVAPVFPIGGNWGLLPNTTEDFANKLAVLRSEPAVISPLRVKNGAVVQVKEEYLAHNVQTLVPELNVIDGEFIETFKKRHADERKKFSKFLESVLLGRASAVRKGNGYVDFTLGVFSMNETNAIRVNNIDYPAYKMSAKEVLLYLDHFGRQTNRKFFVEVWVNDKVQFVPVFEAGSSSKGLEAFHRALEISPTKTGVFMNVRLV